MRMHPFCLLLLVVTPAWVTGQANCILGCKCKEQPAKTVRILDCDSPLVLSTKALANISKKITNVNLKNVDVTQIEKDAFEEFVELERVIIEDSTIGSIDSSAFDLPELGTISFTRTTFGEIPTLVSKRLEELIFNDCKLAEVPSMAQVPALEFLNLANNNIKEIDSTTFRDVPALQELNVSNNSISEVPSDLFEKNVDFGTLNLDNNPLKKFDLNFTSAMEFLSLKNCQLTSFDKNAAKKLDGLSSLDLSGNQIAVLPLDVFESMKSLSNIDLSDNKLVELDDDIFVENSNLDRIILDNNPFQALPKFQTNADMFHTYTFSCKNCSLKSVDVFENMKDLISVDLSHNKIKSIEGVFAEIHGLKKLFLSNNEIQAIGVEAFGQDSSLETLDLSNNPLLPLDPVVYSSLPILKELNISHCNLQLLWANYNARLPSLERLLARNNQFSVIITEDVEIMPLLKQLDLEKNPLLCTKHLRELIDYLVTKSIKPVDVGEVSKTHEYLSFLADHYPTKSIKPVDVGGISKTQDYLSFLAEKNSGKYNWQKKLLPAYCTIAYTNEQDQDSLYDDDDDDDDDTSEDDDDDDDDDDDEAENYEYDAINDKAEIAIEESMQEPGSFNLAKASYILSITSVFILTALLVLFVAVVMILFVMKRNKSFNMHNGDLPRLKIPLWHTTPGQKKHSGSVYRPLSEELSGSRTPIINRYEFKQTPQVHNSIA